MKLVNYTDEQLRFCIQTVSKKFNVDNLSILKIISNAYPELKSRNIIENKLNTF